MHSPLYRKIETDMRQRVQEGRWPQGGMLPSRKSLALEYDVDMRTIQRAISNLLADGTLNAFGGRGTFVAQNAETLTDGDFGKLGNGTVAIIDDKSFRGIQPGWYVTYQHICDGLHRHSADTRIITFNTHGDSAEQIQRREEDALSVIARERFTGVIMAPSEGARNSSAIRDVLGSGIPIVFIDRVPFDEECDFVGIDNQLAAMEPVEHLVNLGHRKIAYLAPNENISTIAGRIAGYKDALAAAGIAVRDDYVWRPSLNASLTRDSLVDELSRFADTLGESDDPPTAVCVVNDFLAEFFIEVLHDRGISVPEDLSVVGFDDLERYQAQTPFLTTVRQPFESIGTRAAELLVRRISAPQKQASVFQHVLMPTNLIIRLSTRAL